MDNTDLKALPADTVTDDADMSSDPTHAHLDIAALPTASPSSMLVLDRHIQHAAFYNRKPPLLRIDVLPFVLLYAVLLFLALPAVQYELTLADSADLAASSPSGAVKSQSALLALIKNDTGDDELLSASSSFEDDSTAAAPVMPALPSPPSYHFYAMYLLPLVALLHAVTFLSAYWSIRINTALRYSRVTASPLSAQVVRVIPALHCGSPALCPLEQAVIDNAPTRLFVFQKTKYIYSPPSATLPACFTPLSYPTSLPLSTYLRSTGLSGAERDSVLRKYGPNVFDIALPLFMDLFVEHAMAPFFVFQVFCVLLWCLDEYWYYSLMTLFMLVTFEGTVVKRRLKHLEYVRDMRVPPFKLAVWREKAWEQRLSSDILPGDLVSMTRTVGDSVCPCDMLILSGQAVVNEALLTGESVPQVKESVDLSDGDVALNINKQHKRHVLYGGTKILITQHKDSADDAAVKPAVKPAPDGGCVCYALKTGFASGQGKLVRTILYSTERVSVNNTESLLFILFLLVFAVAASGYVLYHGLQEEGRSRYKLLLNCVDEDTPVTLADGSRRRIKHVRPGDVVLAYHRQRKGAFAGARVLVPRRVQATLERGEKACIELTLDDCRALTCTPDHRLLVEDGQWLAARDVLQSGLKVAALEASPAEDEPDCGRGKARWAVPRGMDGVPLLYLPVLGTREVGRRRVYDLSVPAEDEEDEASFVANGIVAHNCTMILTSVVPPELPMELSLAVNTSLMQLATQQIFCTEPFRIPLAGAVDTCCFDKTGTLTADEFKVSGIAGLRAEDGLQPAADVSDDVKYVIAGCHSLTYLADAGLVGDPLEKAAFTAIRYSYNKSDMAVSEQGRQRVRILQRFAFTSVLKRMSCIVALDHDGNAPLRVVVKGAAEVMEPMFSAPPSWYSSCHQLYARRGCRVLALGYRVLKVDDTPDGRRAMREMKRDDVERGLTFAGFLVLQCPLKKDSVEVVRHLMDSSHRVVMITGDNTLTACSVARELAIVTRDVAILTHTADGAVAWLDDDNRLVAPFDRSCSASALASLAASHDLCVSGEALDHLLHHEHVSAALIGVLIPFVLVFARAAPDQKELVLTRLKLAGRITLMSGDGVNDCGALRQAHVGVALMGEEGEKRKKEGDGKEEEKKQLAPALSLKPQPALSKFQQAMQLTKKLQLEAAQAERASGRQWSLIEKNGWIKKRYTDELKALQAQALADEPPPIRLGDASIAAPFTSKLPYITSSVDIIRQGRCTLVTTLQMFNILGINCLPEHDTRVLTDSGFLFLSEIEALIEAKEEVLYACYEKSTESIVYKPGRLKLVAPPTRWVDFTHAGTRRRWDSTSDDYGSTVAADGAYANYLTLRTTPDHDMYVQLCTRYGEDGSESYEPRMAGGAPIPPHKQIARELAPGYQCGCAAGDKCTHGYSHYRMYTGAAAGLQPPADVISLDNRDEDSPAVALGLYTTDQLDAFLELFGYWLGDGSMAYDDSPGRTQPGHNAVQFSARKQRDRDMLLGTNLQVGLLARLHLVRGQHFNSSSNEKVLSVRITLPRWFRFFDDEFGLKYINSRHYDKKQALRKQGMHSSQRRPRTPTPSPLPSTTRSLRESSYSSTCDLTSGDSGTRSSSFSVDLTSSTSSTTWTWTPRGRSTSASSTVSFDDAEASIIATAPEPRCLLCDGSKDLTGDQLSGVWHCAVCIAAFNGSTEEVPPTDDDEDDPVKSAKWMPDWVLFRLDRRQLRLVIEGLRQADGKSATSAKQLETIAACGSAMQGQRLISTSGVGFRDQLVRACLHAGYSAYFKLNTRAGDVRGYHAVPYDKSDCAIYTEGEKDRALLLDPTRQFKPVRCQHDNYWVCYNEAITELLPAQDVRFDGKDCRVREKRAYKQGWVAVHDDGTVQQAATQSGLAGLLSCSILTISKAVKSGYKVKRVWSIFTAAEYEEQRSGQPSQRAAAITTQQGDLYDQERDGRVWCVEVEHDDALIFVQRAHCNADGIVTKVGRTTIVGNCLSSAYSMSVLYLDGVKMADTQMTFAGLSIAMFFLFISRSKPLDRLSAERPHSRLFTAHMMLSIIGQFALHMLTLLTAVQLSLPHTPTDAETKSPDTPFAPNVLNTVVYLVSTTATTATFLANYRGQPFMQSLRTNTWLYRALLANIAAVLVMASGLVPAINEIMKLAEMPSPTVRVQLMTLIVFDLLSTVLYANMLKRLFAIKPSKQTTKTSSAQLQSATANGLAAGRLKAA